MGKIVNKKTLGNQKKLKYAFLYTIHNAFNELELNTCFFNKSKFLCDNFDVIINCNGTKNSRLDEIANKFNTNRIVYFYDIERKSQQYMGPPEQINDCYEELIEYELVLHLHADVYIVFDKGIKNFIEKYESETQKKDFYVFQLPNRINQYAFDAWFFKPDENKNIFKHWEKYVDGARGHAEPFFYDVIKDFNCSTGLFDRGPCAGMQESLEPISGLLDTTDINKAKYFLEKYK